MDWGEVEGFNSAFNIFVDGELWNPCKGNPIFRVLDGKLGQAVTFNIFNVKGVEHLQFLDDDSDELCFGSQAGGPAVSFRVIIDLECFPVLNHCAIEDPSSSFRNGTV